MTTTHDDRAVLSRDSISCTAEEIRLRLSDPDNRPTDATVIALWRGMLVALEHVLGEPPTLDDGQAAALLAQVSAVGERANDAHAHNERDPASAPGCDDVSHGTARAGDVESGFDS